jgi:hypothetical protein
VLLLARGTRGLPLQLIAVVSALLGIALGKYLSYVCVAHDAVSDECGATAAAQVSVFDTEMMRFLFDEPDVVLSGWDLLWVGSRS